MKLRNIIASFLAVVAMAVSCTEELTGNLSSIQLDQSTIVFPEEGSTLTINVSAMTDWKVDATTVPAELTISPMEGKAGESTLTITSAANMNDISVDIVIIAGNQKQFIKFYQPGDPALKPQFDEFVAGDYWIMCKEGEEWFALKSTGCTIDDSGSYNYLYSVPAVVGADGSLSSTASNVFTFEAVEGGFIIKDPAGGYLYQAAKYNNFYLTSDKAQAAVWTVSQTSADEFMIENPTLSKWFQYSTNYDSAGAYGTAQEGATLPKLVKAEAPAADPFVIEQTEFNLTFEAGEVLVPITYNGADIHVGDLPAWLSFHGYHEGNLKFTYEANGGANRQAKVVLTTCMEDGRECTAELTFKQEGGVIVEPAVATIASILALEVDSTVADGTLIEAVVISNTALGNLTSKKGMYVQDATGALQLRLNADHTFAFGDKVKIDLSGAKFGKYNEAVQVSNVANEKVTVLSSGNAVEPKKVSVADFLANKYEGQYVALEGVQVVEADLAKTFVVDGAHTSINVETVGAESFIVFSSKYASYGTQTVPQGSGTLKGIAARNNDAIQIIFAQESDFAGLTGARFVPGQEPEQPAIPTIASIIALGKDATVPADTFVEGVVISNMDLSNLTSKKGMYIQDETAGLQFYLAADHSFKFGDKVKVDLSGAKVGAYNGAVQISGLALDKIEVLSSGNTVEPKTVTIADFLANKYEGQYVAIEGVQVADADLSKTFVMGGAHTSIKVENADGKNFVVFSSKYATYGTTKVPQGSGTIKGISSINNGNMQIIFAQNSDYAGLTGERFGEETVEPEPDQPETPAATNRADFETFSDKYGQYDKEFTSAAGWRTVNCAIQEGGASDSNPVFACIGKVPGTDQWARAVCINGKVGASGVLTSPVIAGGCGTLSFTMANVFTDKNGISFQIEVIQNSEVVKTLTVTKTASEVTQKVPIEHSVDVNVSGSFSLKFTNLSPSNSSSSNKDRVSLWNMTWTSFAN